jgi:hypothetical protein
VKEMGASGVMSGTGEWRGEKHGRHPSSPPPASRAGSSVPLVRHRERPKTYRESSGQAGREGQESPMA